jgi:hypothetical protein
VGEFEPEYGCILGARMCSKGDNTYMLVVEEYLHCFVVKVLMWVGVGTEWECEVAFLARFPQKPEHAIGDWWRGVYVEHGKIHDPHLVYCKGSSHCSIKDHCF